MADFPLINGHRYSWASVVAKFATLEIPHFQEISYSDSLEPGIVRGTGPQVSGRTRGEYSAEGSITWQLEGFEELKNHLGDGYMEIAFPIVVSYADTGQPVVTDELVGCRITSVEVNPSQGTDPVTVTTPISMLYIIRNGVKPLRGMKL